MWAKKETLHAVRAICAVGIVVAHVIPGLFWFTDGHTWRVQILFLLGGSSILAGHHIGKTLRYVATRIYLYMLAWTFIYWAIISQLSPATQAALMSTSDIFALLTTELVRSNSHAIWPLLGMWFLLPFSIALVLATLAHRQLLAKPLWGAFAGLAAIAVGWALGGDPNPDWLQRLTGQIILATGYMALGVVMLSSKPFMDFACRGVTAAGSLVVFTWLQTAFPGGSMVISWLHRSGDIVPEVLQSLVIIPAVFWTAKMLSYSKIVVAIGRKSKAVMSHHLAPVVITNLVLIKYGVARFEDLTLAGFYNTPVLWPLYIAMGVGFPVTAAIGYDRLRHMLRLRSLHPAPQLEAMDQPVGDLRS